MNLNKFLYSRTFSNDYRWIFIPESRNESDLNKLISLFSKFRKKEKYRTRKHPCLYSIKLESGWYVGKSYVSDKIDEFGRKIDILAGYHFKDVGFIESKQIILFLLSNFGSFINIEDDSFSDETEGQPSIVSLSNYKIDFNTFIAESTNKNKESDDYPEQLIDKFKKFLLEIYTKEDNEYHFCDYRIVNEKSILPEDEKNKNGDEEIPIPDFEKEGNNSIELSLKPYKSSKKFNLFESIEIKTEIRGNENFIVNFFNSIANIFRSKNKSIVIMIYINESKVNEIVLPNTVKANSISEIMKGENEQFYIVTKNLEHICKEYETTLDIHFSKISPFRRIFINDNKDELQ